MATIDEINSAQAAPRVQESSAWDKEPDGAGKAGRWCWVALVLVIISAAVIRGRLAATPFERDEGEYAYIAQQMLKGVPPYVSAYSMKLPGIYAFYALILVVFGQTHTGVHLGLVVFNAATVLVIFLLAKRMFGGLAGVAAGCAYAILSLLGPALGLMANAEHFVLLPALVGILLVHKVVDNRRYGRLLAAGLLTGLAFVIKQHGIFFAIFGALYLLYSDLSHRPIQWKKLIISQLVFITGAVAPFAFICLYYRQTGLFDKFWFWTFTYAREYATMAPLSGVPWLFWGRFKSIVTTAIPIWLLALLGLRRVLLRSHIRVHAPFIIGFLVFSFLAVCPGLYFRGHYFILFFPAVAVVAGAGFDGFNNMVVGGVSGFRRGLVTAFVGLAVVGFSLFQRQLYLFQLTPTDVCRLLCGGNPFPESLEIAKYIKQHSCPGDTVAVIGSEPQIYFYSNRRAATRYIYMYPLMEVHDYAPAMQNDMIEEIESAKPEWMVFVSTRDYWTIAPRTANTVFEWFGGYVKDFYDTAGVIDMPPYDKPPYGQTIYDWNEQATNYEHFKDGRGFVAPVHQVVVFKRKH